MKRIVPLLVSALAIALLVGAPARAADPRHPDWPCVQAKVPEISVAAVWAGPPLDDVGKRWESDPAIKDWWRGSRRARTPLDEAQKARRRNSSPAAANDKQERPSCCSPACSRR